ncbi:AMP-binding protein [Pareuzebyella sediminis]|uniref:AMP-binding protein n=1 Tax=Pareuzebyella sediminis TaxID=2607998 RepID=UPI0011EE05CD|nr:AMP-binding protein [Pareuzebyella sediminis]
MLRHLKIHRNFKLNGIDYRKDDLKEVAYSLIKEGEAYEKSIGDFLLHWLDDSTIVEVKTSGSTGKPKVIILQKEQMVNSALATADFFGLRPGNSAFLCLPAEYIAGKMMLVRAMMLGLALDFVEPASKPDFREQHYDFCAMVPLQLKNSLDSLTQFRKVIVGGAAVSEDLKSELWELDGHTEVFETYGMTETITHVAVKQVSPESACGTHFKAVSGVRFSIDNRNCLVIDAPLICNQRVITNDLVTLYSDTEFKWLGRFDNVVNSGGVKLSPETIEKKLSTLIGSRFFIAALPDKRLGEKLILVHEGFVDTEVLLQKISTIKTLDKFEIPKAVYCLPRFRETANGKIKRSTTLRMIKR